MCPVRLGFSQPLPVGPGHFERVCSFLSNSSQVAKQFTTETTVWYKIWFSVLFSSILYRWETSAYPFENLKDWQKWIHHLYNKKTQAHTIQAQKQFWHVAHPQLLRLPFSGLLGHPCLCTLVCPTSCVMSLCHAGCSSHRGQVQSKEVRKAAAGNAHVFQCEAGKTNGRTLFYSMCLHATTKGRICSPCPGVKAKKTMSWSCSNALSCTLGKTFSWKGCCSPSKHYLGGFEIPERGDVMVRLYKCLPDWLDMEPALALGWWTGWIPKSWWAPVSLVTATNHQHQSALPFSFVPHRQHHLQKFLLDRL